MTKRLPKIASKWLPTRIPDSPQICDFKPLFCVCFETRLPMPLGAILEAPGALRRPLGRPRTPQEAPKRPQETPNSVFSCLHLSKKERERMRCDCCGLGRWSRPRSLVTPPVAGHAPRSLVTPPGRWSRPPEGQEITDHPTTQPPKNSLHPTRCVELAASNSLCCVSVPGLAECAKRLIIWATNDLGR